ncbi:tyrosine-type recombinase/integrase, partial [Mesorhizobium kowhaii]
MLLPEAERVAAIPRKRTQPAATYYLERDEVERLFDGLPRDGRLAPRDKTLLMFLYNTGARAAEVVGLTVDQLVLTSSPRVNLHGKGDKWRTCPWPETARLLGRMLSDRRPPAMPTSPVFLSNVGKPLPRNPDGVPRGSPPQCKPVVSFSPHGAAHRSCFAGIAIGVSASVVLTAPMKPAVTVCV